MLLQPPNRLHWVQVRDAVAEPDAWQRGRILAIDGTTVEVESDTGRRTTFECKRIDRCVDLLADVVAHEDGGPLALWTRTGRVIAVPIGSACVNGRFGIVLDHHVVIVEEGRDFELVAEDSLWRVRLFDCREPRPEEPVAVAAARPRRPARFPR